jgi:TetR/AcrR family transcriptional regulator, repressor for neighboring sulfatase
MTAKQTGKPVGREQVAAAVLEHAADLFAERGPAATSTRDIASRAGINQALVFRHFGSKELLVGAVLDHLATRTAAARDADPAVAEAAIRRQYLVIARAVLDGYPVGDLQHRFPGMDELIATAATRIDDESDARLAAAHVAALGLGWLLFGPFIRSAAELTATPEQRLQQSIARAADRILRQ